MVDSVGNIGHDSKAVMVIHISPKEDDICESLCSLNFGQRARGVECHKEQSEVILAVAFTCCLSVHLKFVFKNVVKFLFFMSSSKLVDLMNKSELLGVEES